MAAAANATLFANATSMTELAQQVKALWTAYNTQRVSQTSPWVGFASETKNYIGIVPCAFFGISQAGCNKAPPGTTVIASVVSHGIFGDREFHDYLVSDDGTLGDWLITSTGSNCTFPQQPP